MKIQGTLSHKMGMTGLELHALPQQVWRNVTSVNSASSAWSKPDLGLNLRDRLSLFKLIH